MFSTQSDNCTPFVCIFDFMFLYAVELEEPKIGIWGRGLIDDGDTLSLLLPEHGSFCFSLEKRFNFPNYSLYTCMFHYEHLAARRIQAKGIL